MRWFSRSAHSAAPSRPRVLLFTQWSNVLFKRSLSRALRTARCARSSVLNLPVSLSSSHVFLMLNAWSTLGQSYCLAQLLLSSFSNPRPTLSPSLAQLMSQPSPSSFFNPRSTLAHLLLHSPALTKLLLQLLPSSCSNPRSPLSAFFSSRPAPFSSPLQARPALSPSLALHPSLRLRRSVPRSALVPALAQPRLQSSPSSFPILHSCSGPRPTLAPNPQPSTLAQPSSTLAASTLPQPSPSTLAASNLPHLNPRSQPSQSQPSLSQPSTLAPLLFRIRPSLDPAHRPALHPTLSIVPPRRLRRCSRSLSRR